MEINLTKVQDLYTENYKTFLKEILKAVKREAVHALGLEDSI